MHYYQKSFKFSSTKRKSNYTFLTKSNTKHANLVRQSIVQGLKPSQN